MAIHTDRIVLVFPIAAKNRPAAASLQTLEISESGKEFETLVPLDPALVADYASAFNLPLIEELATVQADLATKTTELATVTQAKTTLEGQIATLEAEKQALRAEIADLDQALDAEQQLTATLTARVAELETTIVELTPPPKPESVTPAQIRLWLIANGISLGTVAQMIESIQDDATRAAAQVRWEYGLVVLRDDPLVQQMGTALGLSVEQMDAAFLAASQIQ
jgi:hypothetical protein